MIGLLLSSFGLGNIIGRRDPNKSDPYLNILIGTSAFGSLMYGGYTWYDEAFLVGCLTQLMLKKQFMSLRQMVGFNWIYAIFLLYLLFEFFNGLYFFYSNDEETLRKFRWLLFIVLLFLITGLKRGKWINSCSPTKLQLVCSLGFLSFYFTTNFVVLIRTGSAAYAQFAQVPERGYTDAIWANTAYVTLSIVIFLVIGILGVLRTESKIHVLLGFLIISLSALNFSLTLSRGGIFLTVLILCALLLSRIKFKDLGITLALAAAMASTIVLGLVISGKGNFEGFFSDIYETVLIPFDAERMFGREGDRLKQYSEVQSKLTGQPIRFLFGYGLRTSSHVISASKETQKQAEYSMSLAPAALIEFGIVGVILFTLLFLRSIVCIYRREKWNASIPISLITGAFLTTFTVNNFEFIPLYLLIAGGAWSGRFIYHDKRD